MTLMNPRAIWAIYTNKYLFWSFSTIYNNSQPCIITEFELAGEIYLSF